MSIPPRMPGEENSFPLSTTDPRTRLRSRPEDHIVNIPLTPIRTNASMRSRAHKEDSISAVPLDTLRHETGIDSIGGRSTGRRRLHGPGDQDGDVKLNKVGRFYEKLINFSIITRYMIYIFPLSIILAIPTLIGAVGPGKGTTIGGVRMVWFFLWIQIIWISLWVSKLFAKALPHIFQVVVGVVSSGVKKYATVIRALELPISIVGWAVTCLTTFTPIMTGNPDKLRTGQTQIEPWMARMNSILGACVISSLVYLAQKMFVQLVSVNYHRKQFEVRIKENKQNVKLLGHLYEVSRKLFPDYTEFAEEDYIIHQGLAGSLVLAVKGGTATPMRQLVGNLNVVGNKVTSAFGNVAREVTGKNVFNPNSAYSVVLDALHRKDSAEALARRIWMSFAAENSEALTKEDLLDVMGPDREDIALECFAILDKDDNGDVSLEEIVMGVTHMHRERRDIAKSMRDVDNAIGVLDNVLGTVVFIVVIFIFVAFNFNNFNTMLAAAGTMMLSLSFIFALTAQEVLGSCVFLFVKHPFDVGDRVDINEQKLIVTHISLLNTVFRRCDNGKTLQVPNNVLNTQWIENVSRSKHMQEMVQININFDTTFDDIQALKEELTRFIKENNRDFRPDFDIEVSGVNDLDKMEIKIQMNHKGNWANGELMTQRRNKFMCALVQAMRKIPIYGPGAGDPGVGEEGKPMYTVAVSDEIAHANMEKANKAKLQRRWDYESSDSESDDGKRSHKEQPFHPGTNGKDTNTNSSSTTAIGLDLNSQPGQTNLSSVDALASTTAYEQPHLTELGNRHRSLRSANSVSNRRQDIEDVRVALSRAATRGRRKVGATVASPPASAHPQSIGFPTSPARGPDTPYLQGYAAATQTNYPPAYLAGYPQAPASPANYLPPQQPPLPGPPPP